MNDLVQLLSQGEQLLAVGGPNPSFEEFQKRLKETGYVFLTFTATRGGTDVGITIDKRATDLSKANFEQRTGSVHLEGILILNYIRVRCVADIHLETLKGVGRLHILEEVSL